MNGSNITNAVTGTVLLPCPKRPPRQYQRELPNRVTRSWVDLLVGEETGADVVITVKMAAAASKPNDKNSHTDIR